MSPGQTPPPIQCYNMGQNGHGIKLYGVFMMLRDNLHAGGPGQGSKWINLSGWHGLDMSITVTKRR